MELRCSANLLRGCRSTTRSIDSDLEKMIGDGERRRTGSLLTKIKTRGRNPKQRRRSTSPKALEIGSSCNTPPELEEEEERWRSSIDQQLEHGDVRRSDESLHRSGSIRGMSSMPPSTVPEKIIAIGGRERGGAGGATPGTMIGRWPETVAEASTLGLGLGTTALELRGEGQSAERSEMIDDSVSLDPKWWRWSEITTVRRSMLSQGRSEG